MHNMRSCRPPSRAVYRFGSCGAGLLLVALATLAVGCGGGTGSSDKPRTGETVSFIGVVQYHDAGMAIGGETDPHGYILRGGHAYERLYLSREADLRHTSLRAWIGERVRVRGRMRRVSAGGVETPYRTFPVLEIHSLERTVP